MGKKIINWKTKGMNRDMSVSAFSPEFSFENINLRLATNEGNTMLSWVTEKGTTETDLSIKENPYGEDSEYNISELNGTVIGTAVINHTLILFTHNNTGNVDSIYKLWYSSSNGESMYGVLLYRGILGFDTNYPLETLVDYETDSIQKVYWTDGKNQPRVINVGDSKDNWMKWNKQWYGKDNPSYVLEYYFDFVPSYDASDLSVTIENKQTSGGTFAPGVIQYCFTYINKYGQQSNIVYCSTLYYLSNVDRGASPTESVSTVFDITLSGLDNNFDYVRLYSIQRTSVNDTPIVKLLDDLKIVAKTENGVTVYKADYVDNGTTGSMMDPTELLYVGGKEISTLTMESKDGTLFMGNLKQKDVDVEVIQDYVTKDNTHITFAVDDNRTITLGDSTSLYSYNNNLDKSQKELTTFKGGEYYRIGFQLQKKNGEWTDPIHIDDVQNTNYPSTSVGANNKLIAKLVSATIDVPISGIAAAYGAKFYDTFKKIRPVIVYPNINDRSVLCQGVLNPTVFNVEDRITHSPDAQPSWFFRPYHGDGFATTTSSSSETTTTNVGTTAKSESFSGLTPGELTPSKVNDDKDYFNSTEEYYVIVGEFRSKSKLKSALESGVLTYRRDVNSKPEEANFVGAILLDSASNKYAFFGKVPFPNNKRLDNSTQYLYYEDLANVEYSSAHFSLWRNLKTTYSRFFYYYDTSNEAPSIYKLLFFTDNRDWNDYQYSTSYGPGRKYLVKFTKQGTLYTSTTAEINSSGAALTFCHYDSLYTDSEDYSAETKNIKQVEIQGSVNKYDSVYSTTANEVNSNTQFFIDQSIVTLNSPDLEFDTTVQKFNPSGLNLRIVGAIPITATASSHTIKASSAMLETNYNSQSDTNLTSRTFGTGEKDINVVSNVASVAYKRLVAETLWNDTIVTAKVEDDKTIVTTNAHTTNYTVYPWHRTGPLNNDPRGKAEASSFLQYKRLANLWFSDMSTYFAITGSSKQSVEIATEGIQIPLTENAEVMNYRIGSKLNYYANIDKVLVNGDGYIVKAGSRGVSTTDSAVSKTTDAISMKYKSTTHAVVSLGNNILPKAGSIGACSKLSGNAFWGESKSFSTQKSISYSPTGGFLWLGELYRADANVSNRFGDVKYNNWLPAGETKTITSGSNSITLKCTEGDTYYQRYDCLKTYPFTEDDSNQIIEILSFMCETHVNIDGRYDRNRGMMNNVNIRPTNFNLLNPVYSQKNNFFTYRKVDIDNNKSLNYPNQIYYSKAKQSGADVDMWTNVTLASTLEMDGNKGSVNSIQRFNNQLIAFQDSGIAQILYNENVQIATTNGVPVELANSGKVQGKRYISNTVGCSNKWSITQSPAGIYFMDSNDKSVYLFNGQLSNISTSKGFNAWCKANIPSGDVKWEPSGYDNFRAFYDQMNQDVLFVNKTTALAYSEKVGNFTSFYDYGEAPYFENFDDTGVWVKDGKVWKHNGGEYCQFFGVNKPYSMTLIANQEPQADKIFTNMEFRACVEDEGTYNQTTDNFVATTPFDSLEAWDEYQHGKLNLSLRESGATTVKASLERKFRLWRCDIPRDNAPLTDDFAGIKRFKVRPLDRMRNPWVYLKLKKNAAEGESVLKKTEVHDIMAVYFG